MEPHFPSLFVIYTDEFVSVLTSLCLSIYAYRSNCFSCSACRGAQHERRARDLRNAFNEHAKEMGEKLRHVGGSKSIKLD